ncbi:MAG: hypothetical protein QXI20_02305 [Candidatus Jordarchaeales archaeon]
MPLLNLYRPVRVGYDPRPRRLDQPAICLKCVAVGDSPLAVQCLVVGVPEDVWLLVREGVVAPGGLIDIGAPMEPVQLDLDILRILVHPAEDVESPRIPRRLRNLLKRLDLLPDVEEARGQQEDYEREADSHQHY